MSQSQCAIKHAVLGHISIESNISPTGVWNSKYCTVSCKRNHCSLDFVIRRALKRIECTAGHNPIKIGEVFYKCPYHGDETAKCIGCVATEDDIGNDAERRIKLKVANNPINALNEFKKVIKYLEDKDGVDGEGNNIIYYQKDKPRNDDNNYNQKEEEEKISIDLTEDD